MSVPDFAQVPATETNLEEYYEWIGAVSLNLDMSVGLFFFFFSKIVAQYLTLRLQERKSRR
jgi:hypothetical protein